MVDSHADLPPSAGHMWASCWGWLAMQQRVDPLPEDTESAEEGTAAHWVFAETAAGRSVPIGTRAPNGVQITQEMLDGAELMLDAIGPDRSSLHIETPVAGSITYGTTDTWRLLRKTLDVWDYKYGYRYVPVWHNPQLILYAAAIIEMIGIPPEKNLTIQLHVVQPRYYGPEGKVRTWVVSRGALDAAVQKLRVAADANRNGGECTPGEYCIDCKAKHACSANQSVCLTATEVSRQPIPVVLSDDVLVRERRLLRHARDVIAARLKGLDLQAETALKAGRRLNGLQLGRTQPREIWDESPEYVLRLGQLFGLDLAKRSMVTPKQAIKLGLPPEIVRQRTKTPMGDIKLIETSIDSID